MLPSQLLLKVPEPQVEARKDHFPNPALQTDLQMLQVIQSDFLPFSQQASCNAPCS